MLRSKLFTVLNALVLLALSAMLTFQILELHAYRCLPFIDK